MQNWFSPMYSGLIFRAKSSKIRLQNLDAAKGVMAQPPPDRKPGNLRLRILSALVFAPPVFAVIHLGSPWFDAVVVIAGLLMSWEWARMCRDGEYALPGWVLTEKQMRLWADPEGLAAHLERACLKNHLKPEDICGGVLFLASDASKMMTGQALVIDGGVVTTG